MRVLHAGDVDQRTRLAVAQPQPRCRPGARGHGSITAGHDYRPRELNNLAEYARHCKESRQWVTLPCFVTPRTKQAKDF